jgi:hypothetical protein
MLTVQNGLSGPDVEKPLVATHVFMLKRPKIREMPADWPLSICSHQIIVREGQWINPHLAQSVAFVGI